jgi:protein TonB
MEASIWRFNRRSGDVPMTSVQPVSAWSGMTPRHLDARALLASLLLHAAIGTVLVIISSGIVLPPAAEPPPLTVTLLPPEPPPAPSASVHPSLPRPSPATPPPRSQKAPLENRPLEPAEPPTSVMPQPESHALQAQTAAPEAPSPPSAPAHSMVSPNPLPGAVQGARAIYQPTPVIPDDLRAEVLTASAMARFHIGVDGTATVELVTATRNPRLNRVLLETLSRWRFFPALKDGRPVASTQDLPISVVVK